MKKVFLLVVSCGILVGGSFAQNVSQKLQKAFQQFESDSQLRHAISSLYVIDAKTGEVVFERNAQVGLAPASTQKIITSVTAFELLGKEYRYKTELKYAGEIEAGILKGNLYVIGSGDPTLGSWRWGHTKDTVVLSKWCNEVRKFHVNKIDGVILTNTASFAYQGIPDGWIWQDIGNYYGAGAYQLNWKENQFDLKLNSGDNIGSSVQVLKNGEEADYVNELKAAAKGTGDNAYVYYDNSIKGTIPVGEKGFLISAANTDPISDLLLDLHFALQAKNISAEVRHDSYVRGNMHGTKSELSKLKNIYTHYSPSLDSIIYWFNKKSINLYGEALVKTFAWEKTGFGSTDTGVAIVKKFWKEKGLDEEELNMYDGSGLSPLNRVTTHAQVEILKYAKTRDWFSYFYDALPEYNGMKMKSGTISDVKGFCGYHTAKDGKEYIFSFLVNNYSGRASQLLSKMYKVLDLLK
ncbi:MAG: D-alanyl-D-alanine carboxypeptidase/D-alanyl-D-alanine-endopeptidase [Chitinophagales bacterium]|nr:D-alanyl-D-alanine carboxypeptidase/D-alanyl-D-alanine-endopeptidase [Chitinophagales bacterium]